MIYSTKDLQFKNLRLKARRNGYRSLPPYCSIFENSRGMIKLMIGYKLRMDNDFRECEMTYDSDDNVLLIIPQVGGSVHVCKSSVSRIISCKAILKYFNITKRGRFHSFKDLDGIIHIDLNSPLQ